MNMNYVSMNKLAVYMRVDVTNIGNSLIRYAFSENVFN